MRRFTSITTMASLVAAFLLPAAPMSHADSGRPMTCHRQPVAQTHTHKHHCDGMEKRESSPASESPEPSVAGARNSQQCPMNCCCVQGSQRSNAANVAQAGTILTVVSQAQIFMRDIAFQSNGFSSHTDRGPPFFNN
jgi:hypothetical protein